MIAISKKIDKIIEEKAGLTQFHNDTLEALSVFNDVCIANNIKYSTFAGTLLGHIRHKGFIPWDDDADIFLARSEYDKFIKAWESSKQNYPNIQLLLPNMHDGIFLDMIPKIINTRHVYENENVYSNYKACSYARIDIFPLDYLPNNKLLSLFHRYHLKILYGFAASKIRYKVPNWPSLITKIGLAVFKCIGHLVPLNYSIRRFEKVSKIYNKKPKKRMYIHSPVGMIGIDRPYKKEMINKTVFLPFENINLSCYSIYHDLLVLFYGKNYLIPKVDRNIYLQHMKNSISENDLKEYNFEII